MTFVFFVDFLFLDRHIPPLCGIVGGTEKTTTTPQERRESIMTKRKKTGLMIGAAAACIAVLCATRACN